MSVARGLSPLVLLLGALLVAPVALAEEGPNGFDLSAASVPAETILGGGPARDEIPGVDEPRFVATEEAAWVAPNNPVLGVGIGDEAHSYPVHLIERHQLVNDTLGGVPLLVSYDPLSATPRAHARRLGERTLHFGVSGLIYNHNFLLYDRETESLWVQFSGEAIAGPLVGQRLEAIPIRQERSSTWNERHPGTRVLAPPLPDRIDYRRSPYLGFITQARLLFPVQAADDRFHPKEVALALVKDGKVRAYLGSVLTGAGGRVEDRFAGERVRISYDTEESVFGWEVPDGIAVEEAFWFSLKAFRPEVEVYAPPR